MTSTPSTASSAAARSDGAGAIPCMEVDNRSHCPFVGAAVQARADQCSARHRNLPVVATGTGPEVRTPELVLGRVGAAVIRPRRGRGVAPEEEVTEDRDRVGKVDGAAVVRVCGIDARRCAGAEKEEAEDVDPVGEVQVAVGVRVATSKSGNSGSVDLGGVEELSGIDIGYFQVTSMQKKWAKTFRVGLFLFVGSPSLLRM